jgi:hypothetical protein
VKQSFKRLLLLATATALYAPGALAQEVQKEYLAKARFLSIAPKFIEWPPSSYKAPNSPLQICVHGNYSFGASLAQFASSATVNGHRLEVKWVRKEQDLQGCQLIFVSRSESKHYDKVLEAVANSGSLTIGEDQEFLHAGGMLSLELAQSRLLFDVNLDAVNDAHLKLSSQLLSLARHVLHRTELARN